MPTKKKKRSAARMFPFREEHRELFKDVVYVVEATYNEQHHFWVDYHYQPRYETCKAKSYETSREGRMITVGTLDGLPVGITINWHFIEGNKVLFWESESMVVDHRMIQKWFKHFQPDHVRETDSGNFGHCVNYCVAHPKTKEIKNGTH